MQISNTMPEGTSSCNIFRKIFRKHKKELRKIAKLRDFSGGGSRDRTGDLLNAIDIWAFLGVKPATEQYREKTDVMRVKSSFLTSLSNRFDYR